MTERPRAEVERKSRAQAETSQVEAPEDPAEEA